MSKQDKAFEKWVSQGDRGAISTWGLLKTCHNDGFAAGREAGKQEERERVLEIIATIQTDPDGACAEITRRIKEQE